MGQPAICAKSSLCISLGALRCEFHLMSRFSQSGADGVAIFHQPDFKTRASVLVAGTFSVLSWKLCGFPGSFPPDFPWSSVAFSRCPTWSSLMAYLRRSSLGLGSRSLSASFGKSYPQFAFQRSLLRRLNPYITG